MKKATIVLMLLIAMTAQAVEKKLWYDRAATDWLEALPIGNSHLGAMIYGKTDTEEIQLNEETFWSGSPHNNNSPEAKEHLQEVRQLIFDGKEEEAHALIDKYFFKGPHGLRYLPLGSVKLAFDNGSQLVYLHILAFKYISYLCFQLRVEVYVELQGSLLARLDTNNDYVVGLRSKDGTFISHAVNLIGSGIQGIPKCQFTFVVGRVQWLGNTIVERQLDAAHRQEPHAVRAFEEILVNDGVCFLFPSLEDQLSHLRKMGLGFGAVIVMG